MKNCIGWRGIAVRIYFLLLMLPSFVPTPIPFKAPVFKSVEFFVLTAAFFKFTAALSAGVMFASETVIIFNKISVLFACFCAVFSYCFTH
jgi:hypothetical protein